MPILDTDRLGGCVSICTVRGSNALSFLRILQNTAITRIRLQMCRYLHMLDRGSGASYLDQSPRCVHESHNPTEGQNGLAFKPPKLGRYYELRNYDFQVSNTNITLETFLLDAMKHPHRCEPTLRMGSEFRRERAYATCAQTHRHGRVPCCACTPAAICGKVAMEKFPQIVELFWWLLGIHSDALLFFGGGL